jgi:hypothetical protein
MLGSIGEVWGHSRYPDRISRSSRRAGRTAFCGMRSLQPPPLLNLGLGQREATDGLGP